MATPLTEPAGATVLAPGNPGRYGPVTLERYDEQTGEVIERLQFEGRIIGSATSEKDTHIGHQHMRHAPKTVKCSACRWLEVTIYRRRTKLTPNCGTCDGRGFFSEGGTNARCIDCTDLRGQFLYTYDYIIYTVGNSNVPGEVDFIRLHQTSSAFEVVELLTVRRTNRHTQRAEAFLPPQHAQALAQAASIDEDIQEAYVNRAVA